MEKIPVKTITALIVILGLYAAAGKIRKTLDLPKTPAKLTPAQTAKPVPPKEAQTSAPTPVPTPVVRATPKPVPTQLPEWQGQYSGINDPRTVTLQTRDEWGKLWQEHHSLKQSLPALPELDFNQVTVVGVYAGGRPIGSSAIEIYDIQPLPDQLVVRYREIPPLPSSDPNIQMIQPYHLQVIPKTTLPVRFDRQPNTL